MISTAAFFLIAGSALIQIVYLLRKRERLDPLSPLLLLSAAVLLLTALIQRSIKIDFAAVTNTFESLLFFSAMVVLLLFIYRIQKKWKIIRFVLFGGTIISIILLAIASSPLAPKGIYPPIPALQSFWLVLHVTFSFIGEAFFALAFITAIYYLWLNDPEKRIEADRIIYTAIAVGYPVFTAGALIFGAVWAEAAWGSFWSWDPKETWALITWLTYTAYLHIRFIKKPGGKIPAILAIIGFLFTLFTFFGVNYLLPGLHSYK